MALGRRKELVIPPPPEDPPKSLIASAARIDVALARWPMYRFTDEAWQREAWQFYQSNGELSYTASYIGAALSLARFYMRHVDEYGVPQGEVEDDEQVAAIASTMLGGPAKRGNILRAYGIGMTVAGDTYLIGRAARPGYGDQWTIVACQYVRMYGGAVQVDFGRGQWETLDPNRDVIIRVWQQSAERPLLADAPSRALLLSFAQLQKLRMFMNSELNSRIANSVLYPLPQELAFPGDADNNIPPGAPGVAQMIYEALASNIEGQGTAAAVGPILFEAPIEIIRDMLKEPIRFDVPLSDHAMDYRKELIQDVARGMNVPSDVVEGMRNANHWQSWWATEEFTTKTVAPLCALFCDALNEAYIYQLLKKAGKDPARYTLWYDLAPLHNSADKFTDTLNLYREGAVSLETLLKSANYTMADAPDSKEFVVRKLWEMVLRDPTKFDSEGLRKFLGADIPDYAPTFDETQNQLPPPPPAPDKVPADRAVGTKPTPAANDLVNDLQASLVVTSPVVPVAHAVVLAALAVAGRRLKTATNEIRVMYRDTDPTLMHTKVQVRDEKGADEILAAAFTTAAASLSPVAENAGDLVEHLRVYTKGLLVNSIPHNQELLRAYLTSAGVR